MHLQASIKVDDRTTHRSTPRSRSNIVLTKKVTQELLEWRNDERVGKIGKVWLRFNATSAEAVTSAAALGHRQAGDHNW